MDIYKHSAVSFALSAILLALFKNVQMSLACFLTGIFVDLDHIFDYAANHELKEKLLYLLHPRDLANFLSRGYQEPQKVSKLYKFLHSIELLALAPLLYMLGIWNQILAGIFLGFFTHLLMDFLPMGHMGTVSIIYKIINGFPTGSDILRKRLSKMGVDVSRCQACGTEGDVIFHKDQDYWYIGFTDRGLREIRILCEKCHKKAHNEEH